MREWMDVEKLKWKQPIKELKKQTKDPS